MIKMGGKTPALLNECKIRINNNNKRRRVNSWESN